MSATSYEQNKIAAADLARMAEGGKVAIVDVRTTGEFRAGHIAGSINVPMDEIESRLADIPPGRPVVLVCRSGQRSEIARTRTARQIPGAVCLEGGVTAWEQDGHALVRSVRTSLALDRQAMIGASLIVLASVCLGAFVSHGWFYLALLPATGLMAAGTTGFCLMGAILSKMPWNRATG